MTIAHGLLAWIGAVPGWWRLQLDAALPDALRAAARPGRFERLLISTNVHAVSFALMGADGCEIFSERVDWADYTHAKFQRYRRRAAEILQGRDVPVSLAIPQAVGRSMLIPRRAGGQARQIVGDYIERKTPLPLDEIFIGWDVDPAGSGKLSVRYVALPKTLFDRTLEQLQVSAAEILTIESDALDAVLIAGPKPAKLSRHMRLAAGLVAVALVFTAVAFGTLAYRGETLVRQLDAELERTAEPARRSGEEARALAKLSQDLATVTALRGTPGVGRIWEDLATILPTSSYLTDLDITETGLQLSGFAASTPSVMAVLEGSSVLREAALSGPITFDATRGRDHFSVQAALKTPRAPAEEHD